jgi:hypothetical protein
MSRAECCTEGLSAVRYDDAPSLLLLAKGKSQKGRRAAIEAGFRIAAEEDVRGAAAAIAGRPGMEAILVDAGGIDSGLQAALARPLEQAARKGASVVLFGGESCASRLESLFGAIAPSLIAVSDEIGAIQALRAAAAARPLRFHDVKSHDSPRLHQLSEEVGRIATILASLSEEEAGEIGGHDAQARIDARFVRAIIRVRRLRDHYFRSEMFADPAWDMLLDLFAARLERQRVAVSSLCIAAAVPATTALRWIKTMTDQHLFVRVADPQDGRRVFIELSDEAAAGLDAYLRAAQRISPLMV